jgi:hypothetical protein
MAIHADGRAARDPGWPGAGSAGERRGRVSPDSLAKLLRAAGVGRVSDTFLVPVADGEPRQARSARVRWRGRERDFWLRVADVPFDLHTMRPGSPSRLGAVFALGPGLTRDDVPHANVLHVQIEGPLSDVEAQLAELQGLLADVTDDVRCSRDELPGRDWARICIAGLVGRPR